MTEYVDLTVGRQTFTRVAEVPSTTTVSGTNYPAISIKKQAFHRNADVPETYDTAISTTGYETYIARNGDTYIARNGDTYIAYGSSYSAYLAEIVVKKQSFTILAEVNPNG